MTEQLHFHFHFHALEKEMATHSSVLAWRIPGTGEPDGLLSMGSHRVRHDWSDLAAAAAAACIPWRNIYLDLPSLGFPCGSASKESACNVGDLGSIPGLGRYPGEEKGYPLQYSCLESSMDCIIHGVAKSQTWLNNFHFTSLPIFWLSYLFVCFYIELHELFVHFGD